MPQTQDNKRTKIKTVLDDNPEFKKPDGDPLLLTMVQGSEAISSPYYLDVVMYAERRLEIDPKLMINTPATVFVRVEDRGGIRHQPEIFNFSYQQRKGVFQTFIKQDRFHRRMGADFNVYAGRIVPAFQIMDQQVRYRIFEAARVNGERRMTFLDILADISEKFEPINMKTYFDLTNVDVDGLAKMEHCVQYGESTFNFLSRLMARYSIWYYFSHDGAGPQERMILGTGHAPKNDGRFPACTLFKNFPDRRDIENNVLVEDWQFITGMSRLYTPAPRRVRTSDFNTVISTQPPQSTDSDQTFVNVDFDIIHPSEEKPRTNYVQEAFPDSTIYTDDDATGDATTALEIAEGQVFTITAVSKNPTFGAGKRFEYEGGSEDNVTTKQHLITRMTFNAYDRDYLTVLSDRRKFFGLASLLDDLLVQPGASFVAQFGSSGPPDLATAMASAGLQEAIAGSIEDAWQTASASSAQLQNAARLNLPDGPSFGSYFVGGMTGYIAAFLPNTTSILQDLLPVFQGAVTVLGRTIEVLIQTIALPATIISLLVGNNLARDIHENTDKIIDSIVGFLQHLLHVADVDAYSGCFVASPLDKSAIGIPLPGGRISQIFGPHLATVIGQDGIDISPGEVFADKAGRVRVRFPWDREPGGIRTGREAPNKPTDPNAKNQFLQGGNTMWMRVSEGWAGLRQFGSQFLPRVGDEVIVSFIDSDPDRPIITGRVYNSFNADSNLPLPNEDDKTTIENMNSLRKLEGSYHWSQTGIRTRILKQDGENKKYHLLRFDDDPDHKQYLLRSQGRMDVTVMESYYNSTYQDYHLTIGGKDEKKHTIGGDFMARVYRDYHLHVGDPEFPFLSGNRNTRIEQNDNVSVWATFNQAVGGDWSVSVGGNPPGGTGQATLSALGPSGQIVLASTLNITLMVGASSIVITPAAIAITSPAINLVGSVYGAPVIGPPQALPPAVPIPATGANPTEPTAADPGNIPKSAS